MEREQDIQAFGEYVRRRSPDRRTPVDYVSDIRQFAAACRKPWREVTMHDIDSFVDGQREAGLSAATVKRRVAALKVFFDFMAEESDDLAWSNPVRSKRHAGKQPKRLPRDLHDDWVEQVWAVITDPRDRAWFALMLRGGLRVGEIVDLQLDDILAPASATQPARLRVYGKGRKERLVLLSADAYAVLATWLQARPATDEMHIFLNDRGRPLTVSGIEWLLHGHGTQAGIQLTPHQLRHTYARQLTEAGMPITSLSKLMGHAQVTTTQVYTAGADPGLAQAYHTAVARLTEPQPTAPPPSPNTLASSPADLAAPAVTLPPLPDLAAWAPELPSDIRQRCLAYYQRCLPTWKPQHRRLCADGWLYPLRDFWRWQMRHRPISLLSQLALADLHAYQVAETARGIAPTTINRRLACVMAVLRAEADQGYPLDASVFRLRPLPKPDSLPRALTDAEYRRLESCVRSRLTTADPFLALENACFFILAHSGLRASECVELQVQDLDLPGQRLIVRQGKGHKDRLVYLSDIACQALAHYLASTSRAPSAPLWLKPNAKPIDYSWLMHHISALGRTAAVAELTCHRLRHTLATRLLNAGMDITRIQKLLGHDHLATTQIYARLADATMETDYRQAMATIDRQQTPLSEVAVPVAGWPTHESALPALLDNSV